MTPGCAPPLICGGCCGCGKWKSPSNRRGCNDRELFRQTTQDRQASALESAGRPHPTLPGAGSILAPALLLGLKPPEGLTTAGYRALILFAGSTFLWISGIIPLAVTSLLAMAAIPLMGIMERKQTYALFGNEALFFILGAFILAAAMTGPAFRPAWRGKCWAVSAGRRPAWP
jgi:hypothetical protein